VFILHKNHINPSTFNYSLIATFDIFCQQEVNWFKTSLPQLNSYNMSNGVPEKKNVIRSMIKITLLSFWPIYKWTKSHDCIINTI